MKILSLGYFTKEITASQAVLITIIINSLPSGIIASHYTSNITFSIPNY